MLLPIRILPALLACCTLATAYVQAESLYEIKMKDIDGNATTLTPYQGKVLLVVNVASQCGFTKQYAALESVYRKYADRGLVVLGFPCNQFGGQEPGSNKEIKAFCQSTYDVTFPLFDKIDVNGSSRHALYARLAGDDSPFPGRIQWNFTKFLIGRDGTILQRFESKVVPDSPEVIAAIEAALAKPQSQP
jgi:glutathione peroxidase